MISKHVGTPQDDCGQLTNQSTSSSRHRNASSKLIDNAEAPDLSPMHNAIHSLDDEDADHDFRNSDEASSITTPDANDSTNPDTSFCSSPTVASSPLEDIDSEDSTSSPIEAAIRSLIPRIEKSVIIKDVAVEVPHLVEVPRGYKMTQSAGPATHYVLHRDLENHLKRKRDEGAPVQLCKRPDMYDTYGFHGDEVYSSGAVYLEGCQQSDLSNEIHPLLSRNRFDDTPNEIYDQLVPALRLASMCLTQPACMQFWVTLALGERKIDQTMSAKYGLPCTRIESHVPLTAENIALVSNKLKDLASFNLVHFAFRSKADIPMPEVWGMTSPICDGWSGNMNSLTRSLVRLHADFHTVAEKLSRLRHPDVSQVLGFSFSLAVLVLHELAHCIEMAFAKQRRSELHELHSDTRHVEPFFLDSQTPPECGRFLESTMFGGEIQQINGRVDCSHGICISDWPPRSLTFDLDQRLWHAIPVAHIQSLFLMKTWDDKGHLFDYTTFHAPRTGATSLNLVTSGLTQWLGSEAAAEELALAKAQPACKKRELSTGEGKDQRSDEEAMMSAIFGEIEASKMEEASRHFRTTPGARRHSFHIPSVAANDIDPPIRKRQRSLSFIEQRQAIADQLAGSVLSIYDGLPTHRGPKPQTTKKPTYEIVRSLARRTKKKPRPETFSEPTLSSTRLVALENRAKTP